MAVNTSEWLPIRPYIYRFSTGRGTCRRVQFLGCTLDLYLIIFFLQFLMFFLNVMLFLKSEIKKKVWETEGRTCSKWPGAGFKRRSLRSGVRLHGPHFNPSRCVQDCAYMVRAVTRGAHQGALEAEIFLECTLAGWEAPWAVCHHIDAPMIREAGHIEKEDSELECGHMR